MTKHDRGYYNIQPGEAIAQIVVQPVSMVYPTEKESLGDTFRADQGFGSSD